MSNLAPHAQRSSADAVLDVSVNLQDVSEFAAGWANTSAGAVLLPFQNPDIMLAWRDTVGAAPGWRSFVVRVDDRDGLPLLAVFMAVAPLGGSRLTVLRFMDGGVIDYNAPILFQPDRPFGIPASELWRKIIAAAPRHDLIALEKMPAQVAGRANPLWSAAARPYPLSGHAMTLPAHWEAVVEEKWQTRSMKTYRRKLRRLEEHGPVTFIADPPRTEKQALFSVLVEQKRLQFKDMGVPDVFAGAGNVDFYRRCLDLDGPAGLSLAALRVNGDVVAVDGSFRDHQRAVSVLTSYAKGEWAAYSCGVLLLPRVIGWHLERGRKVFDFGLGDEDYKMHWCDEHIPLCQIRDAASMAGQIHLQVGAIRRRSGRLASEAKSLFGLASKGKPPPKQLEEQMTE